MNVLYVFADKPHELNCSKFNAFYPVNAINKKEGNQAILMHVDQFSKNDEEVRKVVEQAEVIVVERNYFGDVLTTMMYWKTRGKTLVSIFDDAYDIMLPTNVAYPFWKHGEIKYMDDKGNEKTGYMIPTPIDQFVWGVSMVKGVQVPSRYLAQDWSRYNDTYHIPNYIEAHRYLDVKPLYPHTGIIIGWCGSMSHLASFTSSGVTKALKNVARKYENVKILIGGDKRVFDAITLRPGKKIFQPYVPEDNFLSLLKTLDVAIAPLEGEYDKRRSHIKVLEYMALKIPWVASNYPVYEAFAEYGHFVENTADAWEEKLCYIVDNIEEQRELARGKSFEYAMTQSYDNNIDKTLDIYKQLMGKPYRGYITD